MTNKRAPTLTVIPSPATRRASGRHQVGAAGGAAAGASMGALAGPIVAGVGLVAESFDAIRGSAAGNVAMMFRMLGALQTIGSLTDSPSRRQVLREQAECIAELAGRSMGARSPRNAALRSTANPSKHEE